MPTITGNLSFAIIGQGRQPKRAFKVSRAADGVRFVVVAQKRRTTDVPFRKFGDLLNVALRREGYTVYVFFGKSIRSEGYNTLSGPCIEMTPRVYSRIKRRLLPLRGAKLKDNEFGEEFDHLAAELSELSVEPGCGLSAIELNRDGKVEISLNNLESKEAQDNASQIYFYLRDVCHVHQHHSPTSDTILDVVPSSEGDMHWKRETLYALFRWVIQQKRSKTPSAFIDAKGVLSYARAFTEKHCGEKESSEGLPQYLRDATIESLDAGLARAEGLATTKGKLATTIFNRIFPGLGLVLAFLTPLYKTPGSIDVTDQELLVAKLSSWVNDHIVDVFSALTVTVILANFSVVYRSRLFSGKFWLDVFRSIFPISYYFIIFVLIVLSGSLIVMGIQYYSSLTMIPFDPGP